MNSMTLTWETHIPAALESARQTRRFILADFSKEH